MDQSLKIDRHPFRPVHKMLRFLPIMLCSDSLKKKLLCPVTPPIMLALCPLCSLSPHSFWAKLRHALLSAELGHSIGIGCSSSAASTLSLGMIRGDLTFSCKVRLRWSAKSIHK